MTNIVNSTLPTQNNHSEKNKPDGVFVIKQGKHRCTRGTNEIK